MVHFQNSFTDLNVEPILSSEDFVFVKHANRSDSYRIFATYENATGGNYAFQKHLGALLHENLDGNWRWHHIVTKEHLKKLYPASTVEKLYNEEIPTVLIHQQTEHIDYGLLQYYGVHEVFDLPKDKALLSGKDRSDYLSKLKKMYYQVYEHDDVLCQMAHNILAQM